MQLKRLLESDYLEELSNILVAFIGLFLSMIGAGILLAYGALTRQWEPIVASSVYSTTLILLFVASLLYHVALATDFVHKKAVEVIDHCAIYLLIAGTFTPMSLLILHGATGLYLLGAIWTTAMLGCLHKILWPVGSDYISVAAYVAMGWSVVFVWKPLFEGLHSGGTALVIAGGILYTIGSPFYIFDHKFKLSHAIWHGFVIAGSLSMFLAVLLHAVMPRLTA